MALRHSDVIEVRQTNGKGRGVFARRLIRRGEVIEQVPVLVLAPQEVKEPEKWDGLASYCFDWGDGTLALALGYGSLYNHSYQPNARYDDHGGQTMVFTAIRSSLHEQLDILKRRCCGFGFPFNRLSTHLQEEILNAGWRPID